MEIGIPKEIAAGGEEKRVAILPSGIEKLVEAGHDVYVEKNAGARVYVPNSEYVKAGAKITESRQTIFSRDLVVKLKAPLPDEFLLMKDNILFSMFHHEQNPEHIKYINERNVIAIEMESIVNEYGERFVDATHLTGEQGVIEALREAEKSPEDLKVLVLGYGRVASGALSVLYSLIPKSQVKILRKVEYQHIEYFLEGKDLLVNAITWPKYKRDKKEVLVTKEMLRKMNYGAIVLDLSVDFPSPIEGMEPTQLNSRWFYIDVSEDGAEIPHKIKFMSIYGYPGLAPLSCVKIYNEQITPLVLEIANKGLSRVPDYIKNAIIYPETK